jgi:uncharacterized protein YuzE
MRTTYDADHDIAYIYLHEEDTLVQVEHTSPGRTLIPLGRGNFSLLNLDWDPQGRLVGIEVAPASKLLHPELLQHAERV